MLSISACSPGDAGGVASDAACAIPEVSLSVAEAGPGQTVTVSGKGLFNDCYDTGQGATPPALFDVDIVFANEGRSTVLATVDADPAGTLSVDVQVPADAAAGDAWFSVKTSNEAFPERSSDLAPIVITAPAP